MSGLLRHSCVPQEEIMKVVAGNEISPTKFELFWTSRSVRRGHDVEVGSEPEKSLKLMANVVRSGEFICGIVPLSMLLKADNICRLAIPVPHEGGIGPVNALPYRYSCVTCDQAAYCGGSVPVIRFDETSIRVSVVRAEYSGGSDPVILLFWTAMVVMLFQVFPYCGGSVPIGNCHSRRIRQLRSSLRTRGATSL